MQYVWQHRLWGAGRMHTEDGRRLNIIDQGLLNRGAGPDFFKACVMIDGREWVGDVEIHVKASDWHRHGHDNDPAYDSVVLHVVGVSDCRIYRRNGEEIPQVTMPCSPDFSQRYHAMVNNPVGDLPCAVELASLPSIYIHDWLTSLAYERLYHKTDRILAAYQDCDRDWRNAAYIITARALGFKTNAEPFERLARSLPLRRLMKHRDTQVTVEGMLFGMAGLLDDQLDNQDPYVQQMIAEYRFMTAKFGMEAPSALGWKMARMRPHNFPHRRLATLAELIMYDGFALPDKAPAVENLEEARNLFRIELQGYWAHRFNFGNENCHTVRALSDDSVNILVINVVVPLMYAYGLIYGEDHYTERAIELLRQIKAENNYITRIFEAAGVACQDAFTSQAMIELRTNYCESRKCLYCRIGHRLLADKVRPE